MTNEEIMQIRREKFEMWAICDAWLGADEEDMKRDGDGYYGMEVHTAWIAYNAALDSVVIELPQSYSSITGEEWMTVEDVNTSLTNAGIKTK